VAGSARRSAISRGALLGLALAAHMQDMLSSPDASQKMLAFFRVRDAPLAGKQGLPDT